MQTAQTGILAPLPPLARYLTFTLGDTRCIADALREVTGVSTVVLNGQGRARALEGLDERTEILSGALSGPVEVPMNGAIYLADLAHGQKTGLFYDQRPNHAFGQRLAQGARVLDVFSHVGGFGLAALAAGATHATCVDGSAPALELARGGARAMGAEARLTTRQGDAFAQLEALAEEGAQFDLVICDPPAFAPSKQALEAGLRAYERVARLAAPLVAPGGMPRIAMIWVPSRSGRIESSCSCLASSSIRHSSCS